MRVHDSYGSNTWDKIYEADHIQKVLTEIKQNIPKYLASYWKPPKKRKHALEAALDDFVTKTQPKYQEFLNLEMLSDYEADPSAFKADLKKEVPIIQGAYYSHDEAMKKYKREFNLAKGVDLLKTTKSIVTFAEEYMAEFDEEWLDACETLDDLEMWELQEEEYKTSGVIGEGIKAHFLYCLYPNAFPNRGQLAIWSLYFLSGRKEFGFWDGSEFLMIDVGKNIVQQNFLYPYDLFSYYAHQIYLMLREYSTEKHDYHFDSDYRYVYLQNFFDHIAGEVHQEAVDVFSHDVREFAYAFS